MYDASIELYLCMSATVNLNVSGTVMIHFTYA
uniref:Uncharacterized protein n=1 Tax=Setaria italica TaxID=4555 RepID=K4ANF9_SETIT